MSNLLHICLYNLDPEASTELREHITNLNFVRLTDEVSTPEQLAVVLEKAEANVVFFNLDPEPSSVVEVIEQVSTSHPEIATLASSERTDPHSILEPMRAGCDQFVCKPIDTSDLAQAIGKLATKRLSNSFKSRCICVVSPSGGSGATSIACNLAMEIGLASERPCALVDADLQFGDCAMNFDCDPKYSLFDLVESISGLDHSLLKSTAADLANNVSLFARPKSVDQDEQFTPEIMHRIVEQLAQSYENIVIDLPQELSHRTAAVLRQADLVLVVTQLLVPNIRNTGRYVEALWRIGLPEDRVEVILNRCDGRSGRVATKDVEAAINKPVYATIPNDFQYVARSIDFGRPIASLDERNPVRTAIRKIAGQILAKSGGPLAEPPKAPRGFLGRLLTR